MTPIQILTEMQGDQFANNAATFLADYIGQLMEGYEDKAIPKTLILDTVISVLAEYSSVEVTHTKPSN